VIIFAIISLSIFAALRPYLLKQTVDGYIATEDKQVVIVRSFDGNRTFIRSIFSISCFLGKLARSGYCKDIRTKLFQHILSFRMKYFDHVPVGQLVRSVSDIESIARF
jgi:ABC-type bacteriocin/lantibiotic exporter with double-glycine peptidase domain